MRSLMPVWKLYYRRYPSDAKLTCAATFTDEGVASLALCALALATPPKTWKLRKRWTKGGC